MTNTEHPAQEALMEFIDRPDDPQLQQLGLHLANCASCRQQASLAQTLATTLPTTLIQSPVGDAVLTQDEMLALSHGTLSATHLNAIKQDHDKLKAALHLASHAPGMRVALPAKHIPAPAARKPGLSEKFGAALTRLSDSVSLRPPVWSTVALSAALVAGLSIMVNLHQAREQVQIVAYQDNPVLIYKQVKRQGPGIGFFSDISTEKKPFRGMDIQTQGNDKIRFQWPAINDASGYTLRLQRIRDGKTQLISEIHSEENWVQLESVPLRPGVRYEWQLSGETRQHKTFKTAGGFVIQGEQ